MKFMLVTLFKIGASNHIKIPPKIIEMKMAQVNEEESLKLSKAFKISLLFVDIRFERQKDNEKINFYGVEI